MVLLTARLTTRTRGPGGQPLPSESNAFSLLLGKLGTRAWDLHAAPCSSFLRRVLSSGERLGMREGVREKGLLGAGVLCRKGERRGTHMAQSGEENGVSLSVGRRAGGCVGPHQ